MVTSRIWFTAEQKAALLHLLGELEPLISKPLIVFLQIGR